MKKRLALTTSYAQQCLDDRLTKAASLFKHLQSDSLLEPIAHKQSKVEQGEQEWANRVEEMKQDITRQCETLG